MPCNEFDRDAALASINARVRKEGGDVDGLLRASAVGQVVPPGRGTAYDSLLRITRALARGELAEASEAAAHYVTVSPGPQELRYRAREAREVAWLLDHAEHDSAASRLGARQLTAYAQALEAAAS